MTRFVLALPLILAACQQAAPPVANDAAVTRPTQRTSVPAASAKPERVDPSRPDLPGAGGAAAALRTYLDNIADKHWTRAHALWGDDATAITFERRWRDAAAVRGEAGTPGAAEGACGSIYSEVPVRFSGTRHDGSRFEERGTALLRRVNGVDGATPRQLRWHIDQIRLEDSPEVR